MNDQMKEEFIKFANHWRYDLTLDENDFYECVVTQRVWDSWSSAWNASRQSVVIVLPQDLKFPDVTKKLVYVTAVKQAISKAGVSYK
jgi:hypothetical protein